MYPDLIFKFPLYYCETNLHLNYILILRFSPEFDMGDHKIIILNKTNILIIIVLSYKLIIILILNNIDKLSGILELVDIDRRN